MVSSSSPQLSIAAAAPAASTLTRWPGRAFLSPFAARSVALLRRLLIVLLSARHVVAAAAVGLARDFAAHSRAAAKDHTHRVRESFRVAGNGGEGDVMLYACELAVGHLDDGGGVS